jgi:hypothetical protein
VGAPKEALELLNRVRLFKKMDIYERQMYLNGMKAGKDRDMIATLFKTPGEL